MTERKTIEQVYADRNAAAMAFCESARVLSVEGYGSFRAGWHPPEEDDADADEWAIVWAKTPAGQVTWHVPRRLAIDSNLPRLRLVWDGHDRREKNDRLRRFVGLP